MTNHARNQLLANLGKTIVGQAASRNTPCRMLGGIAIYLKCPRHEALIDTARVPFSDLDLATTSTASASIARLLTESGCEENESWRRLHGYQRRIFFTPENITVEVYFDDLHLAQVVPLRDRLTIDYPTICVTDLLLSRVQRVELGQKDFIDICALLSEYPLGNDPVTDIDLAYIEALVAKNWRWWRTFESATSQLRQGCDAALGDPAEIQAVISKLSKIEQGLRSATKSPLWKVRSMLGEKVKWFDEVEGAG